MVINWDLIAKSRKQKNREKAEYSKAKGDVAESIEYYRAALRGKQVTKRNQRIGGFDQYQTPINIFLQKSGPTKHVEIKANKWNRLTTRQKLQQKRDPHFERRDVNVDNIPGSGIFVEGQMISNRMKRRSRKGLGLF
ncbi:MAG: hypothetical protein JRN68_07735 [Nitrososphaerota archaeon]|nr:hypothetical protein [Nitrososphaerota archaeon]